MKRDATIRLTRRLIHRILSDSTDEAEAQQIEPSSSFLDPERHQREREQLFLGTPQVIGFAGQVAKPGTFITAQVIDVPVVVTRTRDGELRAFVNACGHRGARVAEGAGTKPRLVCRFHGWSYDLDGKLVGRPRPKAFDAPCEAAHLIPLPVCDRAGLIVVGLKPEISVERVHHFVDDIAPGLEGFPFDRGTVFETRRYEVAANWKLVVNLSHEGYHFASLHRASLAPLMTGHAVFDEFGLHTRWAFPSRGLEKLGELDESQWPDRPAATLNHTIFPGTIVLVNHDSAQMIRTEPGPTPDTSVVHYIGLCEDLERLEETRAAYAMGGEIFENEDLPIAVECQQGLAAGRPSLIIGRNEPVVQLWHRRWREALQ